jgi:predicted RNase H-like HicB family nuclease
MAAGGDAMTIPVWVEQQNGKFTASVPGTPQLRATGETRDDAIRALSQLLLVYQARGALVAVSIPEVPVAEVPRRQPTEEEVEATREMVAEIYRERDRLKAQEFPE